ncbi:MAG: hypothetical protein LUG65_07470 [Clostridiales bacterium]|nr:hypothetical protein [Clostridiales bacterium]
MNEYVYLYELDTVNKSLGEMQAANERMYQVLVNEGDLLVLTYNQLGDSVLIGEWIQNERMSDLLVNAMDNRVGESGENSQSVRRDKSRNRVVISPFGKLESCVEYIQENALRNSINRYNKGFPDKEYIFSALPFLQEEYDRYPRHVIYCHMLDALTRANVNYLDILKEPEQPSKQEKRVYIKAEHVEALKKYVRFLLRVNLSGVKYLDKQKYQYRLYDCVQVFLQEVDVSPTARAFLNEVVTDKSDGRSEVLNILRDRKFEAAADETQVKMEAEAAVNFCYNWQLERNIEAGGTALKGAFAAGELSSAFAQFRAFYEKGHIYLSLQKPKESGPDAGKAG